MEDGKGSQQEPTLLLNGDTYGLANNDRFPFLLLEYVPFAQRCKGLETAPRPDPNLERHGQLISKD